MRINNKPIRYGLTIFAFFFACAENKIDQPEETILARIAEKTISIHEFIRRAEYTIRPIYCRSDNYIHRKIVLNSLLAEKLFALEEGIDNELVQNPEFQLYLRGRKEQAMHQWFYQQEFYKKVQLDSGEIKEMYRLAGRTYNVNYFTFNNDTLAAIILAELQEGTPFETIFQQFPDAEDIPTREISFKTSDDDLIHGALFSDAVQKGQVIGPLRVSDGSFIVMQIAGWTDRLAITENQINERNEAVKERLTAIKANGLYNAYIKEMMRGKTVFFQEDTFRKLVNIIGTEYYKSDQEKREAFNKKFWNKDNAEMILDNPTSQREELMDQPLLTIEDETWTVRDFEKAITIHPLVFRKKRLPQIEFAEQFKLAVVDLIRDQYIIREAYQRGYEEVSMVQRTVNMWNDNLLSLYHREKFLKSIADISGKDQLQVINSYLDPYVQSLQKKYEDVTEINTDAFEKINLTSIDMFVIQKDMPFPVVVPSFPHLTTYDKLDYGRQLKLPIAAEND
jgi:hypothetical protein